MKTKKTLSINKLLPIILSTAAVIVYIVGIIMTCKSKDGRLLVLANGIVTVLALMALIALIITKRDRKYILVPLLILLVTISYYTQTFYSVIKTIVNASATSLPIPIVETSTVFDLVLLATLIVAYVFALKNQRWAKIIVYVIIGLMTATLYINIIQYGNILAEISSTDISTETKGFIILLIGGIITYITEIVYFAVPVNKEVSTEDVSDKTETLEVEETDIK